MKYGMHPDFYELEADHLRPGERIRIIAINRVTGYVGSITTEAHNASSEEALRDEEELIAMRIGGELSFEVDDIIMRPPNLKIWARRSAAVRFGAINGEEEMLVKLNGNEPLTLENTQHLSLIDSEGFLTLRLYSNNDSGNILWEFAFPLCPDGRVESVSLDGLYDHYPVNKDIWLSPEVVHSCPGEIFPVLFDWDYGDGEVFTTSSAAVIHMYKKEGFVDVKVKASCAYLEPQNSCSARDEREIEIIQTLDYLVATDLKDPTRKAVSDGVLGALPVLQMVRSKDVGSFRAANVKAIPKMGYTFTEGVEPTWTGESLVDRSSGMTEVVWQHQNVFTLKEDVIASDVVEKLVTIEIVDNAKREWEADKLQKLVEVVSETLDTLPDNKPCTADGELVTITGKATFEPVDVKERSFTGETVDFDAKAEAKLTCEGGWPGLSLALPGLAKAGLFLVGEISAGLHGKFKWDGTVDPPVTTPDLSASIEGDASITLKVIAKAEDPWGFFGAGTEVAAGPKYKVVGTIEPVSKGLEFKYKAEFGVSFSGKYWYIVAGEITTHTVVEYKPDWGNTTWDANSQWLFIE